MADIRTETAHGPDTYRASRVVAALDALIARQVMAHGLVVWFDPERHYADLVPSLTLDNTKILQYRGSFFKLRREMEPLLCDEQAPRLVIYVPLEQAATEDALVEAISAGITIEPGASPWQRNTRLWVVVRQALKGRLSEESLEYTVKQVEAGRLGVTDIDRIAEQGEGVGRGMLALIFEAAGPDEIALAFLSGDRYDEALAAKGALPELARLLEATFDVQLDAGMDAEQLRRRLARHVLATELIASLDEAPAVLATLPAAERQAARDACCALARTWRLRRDLAESYAAGAAQVETELRLAAVQLPLDQLSRVETFLCLEEALQTAVEVELMAAPAEALLKIAEQRQSSFWSGVRPEVQARWALIATAARVLLEAGRVATAIKGAPAPVVSLLNSYASGERPWCLLDTAQRHLERRAQAFDFDLGERHQDLWQLVALARQRYMDAASTLAERFVRAYQAAGFVVDGIARQRDIFSSAVRPALKQGKMAYVLVDALRFEMARELVESVGGRFEGSAVPALATVPTITEVGMAALLPEAETGVSLVQAGGRLALQIGGAVLKNRRDRVEFLEAHAGVKVYETNLESLAPIKRAARTGIEQAELVLVTSQEIDALCEGDNIGLARSTMDGVLRELERAFQVLAGLGVQRIVVTADHGFIFGDELDSDMKIDPPGGETADLHRRVWVGRGGAAGESYLRASAAAFGLGGDLEIATPWNLACFKVQGGARAYFHGGLSPQEIVVPVAVLTPKAAQGAAPGSAIAWQLQLGSRRITTRFCSVQVGGRLTQLLEVRVPAVRVELRDARGPLSVPVSSSYGFNEGTEDVQLQSSGDAERNLQPNTITLMLNREPAGPRATVHLLDVATGQELAHLGPVEIAIAI